MKAQVKLSTYVCDRANRPALVKVSGPTGRKLPTALTVPAPCPECGEVHEVKLMDWRMPRKDAQADVAGARLDVTGAEPSPCSKAGCSARAIAGGRCADHPESTAGAAGIRRRELAAEQRRKWRRELGDVLRKAGPLSTRNIAAALPDRPRSRVENLLRELRNEGRIATEGAGKYARWTLTEDG